MLFPEDDSAQLKAWIVRRLENTSEADLEVLADYVIALLKHDGDLAAIRALCDAEIPQFLSQDPKPFLDDLFRTIQHKAYQPGSAPPSRFSPPLGPEEPAPEAQAQLGANPRKRTFDERRDGGRPTTRGRGDRPVKQPRRGKKKGGRDAQWPMGMPLAPGISPGSNGFMDMMQMQMQTMGLPWNDAPQQDLSGANGAPLGQRTCPEYETSGFCARGDACSFNHGNGLPEVQNGQEQGMPNMQFPPWAFDANLFQQCLNATSGGVRGGGRGRGRGRGRGNSKRGGRAAFSTEGPVYDQSNTTIVVENIPKEKFKEDSVRAFFEQYGPIIDVRMHARTRLAIVKFDSWASANDAYCSPKVIFDNRFVKVFWHKENGDNKDANGTSNGDGERGEEIDLEDFQRRQEEAQKQHLERETKRVEIERQRVDLETKQQALLARHREESEKLRAKTIKKEDANGTPISSGTEALRAQLAKLEQEAKILGIDPEAADDASSFTSSRGGYRGRGSFRGRGYLPRRRGGFRGTEGRHAAYAQYSLDNRPRGLSVTGLDFTVSSKDEALRQFLLNLGEFESIEASPEVTHVSFQDRKTAEKFYYSLNEKELPGVEGKLELAWFQTKPSQPSKPTQPAVVDASGTDGAVDEDEDEGEIDESEDVQHKEDVAAPMNLDYDQVDDWIT